jgi:hypothetical protein
MTSDFVPNSYQTPNGYSDKCMAFLTPEEWKVLSYFCRRIFGFNKRQDRVSISQLTDGIRTKEGEQVDYGTGLSAPAARKAVAELRRLGILIQVAENDPHKNQGPLYELQLDGDQIDLLAMYARAEKQSEPAKAIMEKARAARKGKTPSMPLQGEGSMPLQGVTADPLNAITGGGVNAIIGGEVNGITGGGVNGISTQYPVQYPVQKTDQKKGSSPLPKNSVSPQKTAHGYLQQLKGQLLPDMSKAHFDTWVRGTVALGWDGDVFQIGCGNAYCRDWLDSRIASTCNRVLSGIVERSVTVRFMVADEVPA